MRNSGQKKEQEKEKEQIKVPHRLEDRNNRLNLKILNKLLFLLK